MAGFAEGVVIHFLPLREPFRNLEEGITGAEDFGGDEGGIEGAREATEGIEGARGAKDGA